ncbi:hypothetical protein MTO96_050814 [Rhipicephalus appendiculatus]
MWHLSGEPTVPPFLCTMEMFGKPFPMELDAGVSVSVMPMDKFQRAFPEVGIGGGVLVEDQVVTQLTTGCNAGPDKFLRALLRHVFCDEELAG